MLAPPWRRFALLVHVVTSVGWMGAVAAFLALAVSGLTDGRSAVVQADYIAIGIATWAAILPLAIASLASGIVSSLGTPWGLVRHYWILVKLLVTIFSTAVLVVHLGPIDRLGRAALVSSVRSPDLASARVMVAEASALALAALLLATVLSIYKPQGVTTTAPTARRR